jgi:hypothetical protein
LARTRLDLKADAVTLQAEEAWAAVLLGEQTVKRAQTLAGLLDRTLRIRRVAPRTRSFAGVL